MTRLWSLGKEVSIYQGLVETGNVDADVAELDSNGRSLVCAVCWCGIVAEVR